MKGLILLIISNMCVIRGQIKNIKDSDIIQGSFKYNLFYKNIDL